MAKKLKLVQHVALKHPAHALYLDLEHPDCIAILIESGKKNNPIVLEEFLFHEGSPVKNEKEHFTNEFLFTLKKAISMIKRSYLPGEDWLYYKIYCGKRTADQLLVEEIQPLVQELTQEERIDQWFYLRYSDPQPHLRLRFLSPNTEHRNYLQQRIPAALTSYFQKDLIWKVQMDTYNRELERYGTTTIELSEYVFSVNSQLCLNVLEHLTNDTHVFLISLKVIDELLNSFGYTLDDKINLSKENFEAFKDEFNADKQLKNNST